ncbi:phospholipase-like protein [Tanacetum coccineum]
MLQRQCYVNDAHYDMLYVHGRGIHFGRREFSLITGLHFEEVSFSCYSKGDLKYRSRVFPHRLGLKITSLDLIGVIEDEEFFSKLCVEDAVRVCLLLSLKVIFMGRKLVQEFDDTLMSISSGTCCSDLDIDEDADEFRMKLKEEEMLLFKEEQILEEESKLRLEEEAKMMREEENMLEEEKIHKKIIKNDLSRCNTSIDNVWLTEDLDMYLGKPGMLRCRFPWCNDWMVDRKFWESLVCLDPTRTCWILDNHIDLWVEYMWHVRPKLANWAMVSSYFVQLLLQNSMPIWYANGETYNLPWSAVEKVFIPLNEPGEHWNLAKFDIYSGLVTFYDSGDTYAIECRDWYIRITNCLNVSQVISK